VGRIWRQRGGARRTRSLHTRALRAAWWRAHHQHSGGQLRVRSSSMARVGIGGHVGQGRQGRRSPGRCGTSEGAVVASAVVCGDVPS
jgi:hypothetical protein